MSKQNEMEISMIGIGGGGSNMLNAVIDKYGNQAESMIMNRDKRALNASLATEKVYLKANTAEQVKQAVEHNHFALYQFLKNKDGLIILAGMGGFSGTYASPAITNIAKELNVPTFAFITLPFDFEGADRMEHAREGEKQLIAAGATVTPYPNQDLCKKVPANTSMLDAFKLVDQEVFKFIESFQFKKPEVVDKSCDRTCPECGYVLKALEEN